MAVLHFPGLPAVIGTCLKKKRIKVNNTNDELRK